MAIDTEILKEGEAAKALGALRILLETRADGYEIFFSHDSGLSVEVKDREVDAFKVRSATGVGIRTLKDGHPGFAYSSVLDREALEDMVEKAMDGAKGADPDPLFRFADPRTPTGSAALIEGLIDTAMDDISEAEKVDTAKRIEAAAMDFDPRVKRVRQASYSESFSATRVINSNGVDTSHSATYYSGSIAALAEEGEESQIAWEVGMGHARADVEPEEIGRAASTRVVGLLGSSEIDSVRGPAILENTVVMDLLGALSTSFRGDNVLKGKSMLIGKLEQKIFSDMVNIYDDGLLAHGWSTSEADAEGVPSEKTPLIEAGVLMGFLYDIYWAERAGLHSTGNARRASFSGAPSISTSNLYMEKGEESLDALMKEMGQGLFVTELMGVHTVNPVTGDFSLGAQGFWVEGGKVVHPVRGAAVAGNLLELFSKVSAVGSDLRFIGSTGAPSLLFSELDISGK